MKHCVVLSLMFAAVGCLFSSSALAEPFDTDGDGLLDADEVGIHGTDPNDSDSDDDSSHFCVSDSGFKHTDCGSIPNIPLITDNIYETFVRDIVTLPSKEVNIFPDSPEISDNIFGCVVWESPVVHIEILLSCGNLHIEKSYRFSTIY